MSINLSVIIPSYNNGKYLERAISSILKNKISLEIIVIDDCSTDDTKKIMKKLTSDKVSYYRNKKNLGVSASRNLGLEKAKGEFIGFVDADDFVDERMYEILYQTAKEEKLDVCGCDYYEIYTNDEIENSKYHYPNQLWTKQDLLSFYLTDLVSMSACDKIFRKKIITKGFETKLKVGEDLLFCLDAFLNCKRSRFFDFKGYAYVQNRSSAVHTLHPKLLQIKEVFPLIEEEKLEFLKECFPKEYFYFEHIMTLRAIHTCSLATTKENKKEAKEYLKKLKKELNIKLLFNTYMNFYYKIEVFILKCFGVNAHLLVFPIYKKIKRKIRK